MAVHGSVRVVIDSHCHLADPAFDRPIARRSSSARARRGWQHALCILAAENNAETKRCDGAEQALARHQVRRRRPSTSGGTVRRARSRGGTLVRAAIAATPGARAVGEIGLDYHYDFAPKPVQQAVFRAQVRLARELDLPIIIHTREAEDDTLAILREESGGNLRGVLHCFTGTPRLADEGLALGMHISFAGIVTFPKAGNLREIAASVPGDRLLCETDSPYLAPTPYRGKRNEPAWVVRVAEELAAARGEPVDVARSTDRREFFRAVSAVNPCTAGVYSLTPRCGIW